MPSDRFKLLSAVFITLSTSLMAALPAQAASFRVNPYLQQPSSDGMHFTWFTEQEVAGTLTITGKDIATPLTFTSTPSFESVLTYTNAELAQEIGDLDPGSWLLGDDNYKHTIDVRGLAPNTTYDYSVALGDNIFNSTFKTAPTADDWDSIRFITFADSETQPAGRLIGRDWQQGALAEGSAERPEPETSLWAETFGTTGTRLRYALTETEGYAANLAIVNERQPDFLMMPGDLMQGGATSQAGMSFSDTMPVNLTVGYRNIHCCLPWATGRTLVRSTAAMASMRMVALALNLVATSSTPILMVPTMAPPSTRTTTTASTTVPLPFSP